MDAADWDQRYAADGLVWTAEPNRFLVAETEDLAPGRALDVACGEGRNALWLATMGWAVTAVDHSEVGLDKARALAGTAGVEVEWHHGDVLTYRPEPVFDLVIVMYLHLPPTDMANALANAAAGLGRAGTMLVVGHHSDNIERGIGGPQVPEILYRPSDVVGWLGDLRVTKAEMVTRPVDRAGVPGVALDTLVRAVRA